MTSAKVAVSVRADVLQAAKRYVKAGRSKSLSALVSEAVEEKLLRDDLEEILDRMDREHGRPNKAAEAWARRLLK